MFLSIVVVFLGSSVLVMLVLQHSLMVASMVFILGLNVFTVMVMLMVFSAESPFWQRHRNWSRQTHRLKALGVLCKRLREMAGTYCSSRIERTVFLPFS